MHHGFPYRSEIETADPLEQYPEPPGHHHQRQQQDQLLAAPGPSSAESPFRRLRIHPPDGRTRAAVNYNEDLITYGEDDDGEDEDVGPRGIKDKAASSSVRAGSSRRERELADFVEPDPDEGRQLTWLQARKEQEREQPRTEPRTLVASDPHRRGPARLTRNSRRAVPSSDEYAEDDDGEDEEEDEAGSDAGEPDHDVEPVRATRRTRRTQRKRKSSIEEEENCAYSLRPRGNVDYHIPMPLEDLPMDLKDRLPRNLPCSGCRLPSNLGRVGADTAAALADVGPLGVNQNVTFDEVGGLDVHIAFLKEMMLLPLLYPELFQRFNVNPPRGVLFHDPPGTGKTLLARALAASGRSGGRQIAFFMRK
ncbi:hypothetical protein AURDEDRAFT_168812, partial [Auricularia subglabra TFB-10046 SS5]